MHIVRSVHTTTAASTSVDTQWALFSSDFMVDEREVREMTSVTTAEVKLSGIRGVLLMSIGVFVVGAKIPYPFRSKRGMS